MDSVVRKTSHLGAGVETQGVGGRSSYRQRDGLSLAALDTGGGLRIIDCLPVTPGGWLHVFPTL